MTEYVVLQKRTSNTSTTTNPPADYGWAECGTINASGAEAAVRAHVEKAKSEGGTFVAIPVRSFSPVTVKIEKVSKVKVETLGTAAE